MTSTLMTTWAEYDAALDRLLALAQRELCIFDRDLGALKLERNDRSSRLRELLFASPKNRLRIAVQDSTAIVSRLPRLARLLGDSGHNFSILVISESLAHLTDSLVIADDRHALIRFHRDQARSKLIEDDPDQTAPYLHRFEDILGEGGSLFSPRPAGL